MRLGEIANLCGGYAFKSTDIKGSVGYRVIRISDITLQGLSDTNIVRYSGNAVSPQFEIQANDILIAMTGGTVGKSLLLQELSEKMYINQRVASVRTIIANPYYLYIAIISSLIQDIIKYAKNSTNDNISMDDIYNFPIPLPPLAEQRRIVAEVEKWFALIDDLETNKQDLQGAIKQVRAKVLDLAIHGKLVPQDPNDEPAIALLRRINPHFAPSDTSHYQNIPFEIPASWQWVKIDDVLTIMNGYAFKSSKYVSDGGVRVIRITNVQDGYVCDDSPQFYPTALASEYSSFLLKEGDLLMSLTGNVGRVGLLQQEMLPAALNQRVACLRERLPLGYLRYIFYLLRTAFFLDACVASGNATAQLNISTGWLKGFLIPLPPLAEQRRIVSEIERIFGVLDTIEESLR